MTNDPERRLLEHNTGKSNFTSRYKPWKIIYTESLEFEEEAVKREKYYKSRSGRRKLKEIIIGV